MTASDNESELDQIRASLAAEQARIAVGMDARQAARIDERIMDCTPYQAAVVVALAARRTTAVGELPKAEEDFEEYGKLIQAAERMNLAYLVNAPATTVTAEVSARLEEILGSEDFPADDPGGSEGYFMKAAISIAYLRDVWTLQNLKYARSALSSAYKFANKLGRHLPTPPAAPLDEAETICQSADLDAVTALGEPISVEQFDELVAAPASIALGQAYRARVAEIIAAGR
ncbi:hypothetical protein [Catenulispora rubra]|uniref:hypothetical protein n=1 Tax=Catenulispora rubra TaxID=280293 RepID=UPI0018924FBF|nr:hypothetical protein [Catenulispora rubra]